MRWALLLLVMSALWVTAPPAASAQAAERVALIGVPGLHWNDLDPAVTPNLWRMAADSGVGSISVKAVGTVTCPYDAWLTVSAGRRAAVGGTCGLPPEPVPAGEGAVVPGFDTLRRYGEAVHAGTLGSALHDKGLCTAAIGRGAALALADRTGRVDLYADAPARLADWARCPVIAADVDELIQPYLVDGRLPRQPEQLGADRRRQAVRAADAEVGEILARLPQGTQVLLAGVGDHGSVPHLRVAMWRAEEARGALLGSGSTRREDIVILPDIAPTVLTALGVPIPEQVVGVPWTSGRAAGLEEAVAQLRRSDLTGTTVRGLTGIFFSCFAVLQVGFYLVTFLLLSRGRRGRGVAAAGLGLASIPAATYLVNLLPWNHAGQPVTALVAGVLGCAALILLAALAGPWRRHPLGPPAVVAGVTGAVLLADLLTGTTMQFNSLMGYTAVVGGRYHGLANIPFALLATAVLMVTAVAADGLVRAGRRRAAVALVAALGVAAMLLAGWPGVGSDFGGVIAFVPGIAVTALLVAGRRVSVVKLGLFCVLGGVTVSALAILDYVGGSQTHLGRFVGQVLDGTFWPLIERKLGAMLRTMLSPNLMPIVVAGLAFLVFAVLRPAKVSAGAVPEAFARAPMLRAGLIGTLVSGVVGMLVNDSGTAVLSMAVALAVPLVLYTGITSADAAAPGRGGGRSPSSAPVAVPDAARAGGASAPPA
ncbi:hypothetical protein [Thermoactinospora rubra]|uniref:hypothetical protein n=1 Tax=Thermoactinospora rubra TaxID=1088767 RepID=UPI000A11868D|nr:hypothetical protein [Thermoactinospora rubra]